MKAKLQTSWTQAVTPERPHPEYPRPQMVRSEWLNLNGLWELALNRAGGSFPPREEFRQRILVPYPLESALSGIGETSEHAWYRRTFTLPPSWRDKRVLLHFGAVDWESEVFVNGTSIGLHRGGYDAFAYDITEALTGVDEQEIVVRVYDPSDTGEQPCGKQTSRPSGIFYTASTGIWQTVWLEPVPETHICKLTITPDVDPSQAVVSVNVASDQKIGEIIVEVYDGSSLILEKTGRPSEKIMLPIPQAKLWSPDHPFLYDLRVALHTSGEIIDAVSSYFGLRKIGLGKDANGITRIMLNNTDIFQVGILDQGFWPAGLYTAPTDEALRYDIEIAKQLGFNTIRKHVKVEPERWYYWCDRLGILVWQDMPTIFQEDIEWSPVERPSLLNKPDREQFKTELRRLVLSLMNHPSIIMWVIFNEGWRQHATEELTAFVRNLDNSRLINSASGYYDHQVGDIIDIHRYPDPESPIPELNRAAVLGEFGGLGYAIQGHLWSEQSWGYREMSSAKELRDRYEALFDKVWLLREDPGLSAVIYTQLTDVETETNGLVTYDRAVTKIKSTETQAFHDDRMAAVPQIHPDGSLLLDSIQVKLSNRKHDPMYYTTNGTEPTQKSQKYREPIRIDQTTELRVKTINAVGLPSATKSAFFRVATCREPEQELPPLQNGLEYEYFEGEWSLLPDFEQLQAVRKGTVSSFSLDPRLRDDYFGFCFRGLVKVEHSGIYTFYTQSDDGTHLYIGNQLVVDNDGIHGVQERRGQIALKAGYHPIRLTFFEGVIDHTLTVSYEGPEIEKQVIRMHVLFRPAKSRDLDN